MGSSKKGSNEEEAYIIMFKRTWTTKEANEWTKEDFWACVLSTISYITVAVGAALALLNLMWGYICLGVGVVSTIILFWLINPKLKAESIAFEKEQDKYLEELEKKVRWEE